MAIRKLKSKKDESKRQKRNQLILGIILIVVMVGGTFGIVVNSFGKEDSSDTNINYNGQEFYFTSNLWYTELGNIQVAFKTNPNESLQIEEEINLLNSYLNKPLYIYSEDYESKIEFYRNLYNLVERVQDACPDQGNLSADIGELNCGEDWPTKNCENNLIIIKESEENKIIQEDNCLIVLGKREDLMKMSDSIILKMVGLQ